MSTVVPIEKEKLTNEECNRVLAEFEREFLRPAASETHVTTELVQRELSLEHELSPEGLRLLRAFAASANRTNLDTNDRCRWNAFLVRVHQDESRFDPSLLDEWLQQNGWSERMRSLLMDEYEAARSLLLAYDDGSETS
ncbi:MAG TPA: hypothetical protein VFI31_19845 [Pirellulales bacterium]|nr:hypothetical protein [Pirellulales bacterium]